MKKLLDTLEPALALWRNFSARERMMIGAAAIALGLFLFYVLVWLPIQRNLATLRIDVPKEHQQVAWMRAQVERVHQLQANAPVSLPSGGLLSYVERSAQGRDLQKYVKRVEPEGQNAVRLVIDGIGFNDLVTWLAILHQEGGMRVDNASVEPQPTPGVVNARLLLRAG